MEKRVILAVVLIIFVLIFFQVINAPQPKKQGQLEESQEKSEEKIEQLLNEAVLKPTKSEEVAFELPLYSALLSENGGISSFRLNEYKTRDFGIGQLQQQLQKAQQQFRKQAASQALHNLDIDSPLLYPIKKLRYEISHLEESNNHEGVELISFSEQYHDYFPPFLQIRDKNNKVIWSEETNYELVREGPNKVQLIKEIPGLVSLKKEFAFAPDSYLVSVKITVENIGAEALENHDFLITCGPDVGINEGIRTYTKFEPVVFLNNQLKREKFGRGSQNPIVEYGQIGWVALQNKYFAKILIPNETVKSAYIQKNEYGEHKIGLKVAISALEPAQKSEFSFDMYLGPKKLEHLYQVGRETSKIVDYGLFGNLFHIVHILKFFHRLTNNYGVAIILLTILINLVLLPLSLKSFASMKEMRKLQSEMERIRKEFKSDPQKMNREVIELYRRHKVNPAGGCLPMLLQLPIFIGLFMTLRSVIELRGAPFILWIKDLSLPDALPLPFGIPYIGPTVNILPILMTAVTFLQQKVSGSAGANQSMMFVFPIIMLFIFYNFPSGLVLYFVCGSLINILAQTWINRPESKKT